MSKGLSGNSVLWSIWKAKPEGCAYFALRVVSELHAEKEVVRAVKSGSVRNKGEE